MNVERAMLAEIAAARAAIRCATEEVAAAKEKVQATKEWGELELAKEALKKAKQLLDEKADAAERFVQPELDMPQPMANSTEARDSVSDGSMLDQIASGWNQAVDQIRARVDEYRAEKLAAASVGMERS